MPERIGQIELKGRWDISEDEEEERRRPGIDTLESAVHEDEEMTRKGMIGQSKDTLIDKGGYCKAFPEPEISTY